MGVHLPRTVDLDALQLVESRDGQADADGVWEGPSGIWSGIASGHGIERGGSGLVAGATAVQ